MEITASVVMKTPGKCRAWIEQRLPWEITLPDRKAKEFWESHRLAVEKGDSLEKYLRPCLVWEDPKKAEKLPGDIDKEVFALATRVLDGNHAALIDFWQEYGPLINRKGNAVLMSELKNTLGFFFMLVDVWGAVAHGEESRLRGYFLRPFEEGYGLRELEEFVQAFTGSPENYRLYMRGKTPVLFSEYGSFVHDMGVYYLQLKKPPESGLVDYARKTVSQNVKRYLRHLPNFTELDVTKGRAVISPPNVFTAALYAFFNREVGKEHETPAKRMSRRRAQGLDLKAQVLDKYRKWEKRGKITPEQFKKMKAYRDRLFEKRLWDREELEENYAMIREELEKELERYFERRVKKRVRRSLNNSE